MREGAGSPEKVPGGTDGCLPCVRGYRTRRAVLVWITLEDSAA